MNYWALTPVMRSFELKPEHRFELGTLGTRNAQISEGALTAAYEITRKLPACTSLVIVCSEGAPMRRAYLKRPTCEDFSALERGGFVTAFNNFGFVMDALH